MTTPNPLPVVCIVGAGRSGSTVLAHLLGESDDVCAVGELRNFWISAVLQGSNCACGLPIGVCEFWGPIVSKLQLNDEVAARFIWSWQKKTLSAKSVRNLKLTRSSAHTRDDETFEMYIGLLSKIYKQVAERSGARVIVDSSKGPIDAAVLARVPGIRPYFVHLVRDPRGVAYSWTRKKAADPMTDRLFSRRGTMESAIVWLVHNLESGILRGLDKDHEWSRVRYEDFVREPEATAQTILERAGSSFRRSSGAVGQQHSIGGNPVRFDKGKVEIRTDDEWVTRMPSTKRRLVTTTTLPLLKAYGYPIRTRTD